jgi:hypothetical protein
MAGAIPCPHGSLAGGSTVLRRPWSRHPFLCERYRRIAKRRGKKRAIVAVGRSILVIVWHLLSDEQAVFTDLGAITSPAMSTQRPRSATTSANSKPSATTSPATPPPDSERKTLHTTVRTSPSFGFEKRDQSDPVSLNDPRDRRSLPFSHRMVRAGRRSRGCGAIRC